MCVCVWVWVGVCATQVHQNKADMYIARGYLWRTTLGGRRAESQEKRVRIPAASLDMRKPLATDDRESRGPIITWITSLKQ